MKPHYRFRDGRLMPVSPLRDYIADSARRDALAAALHSHSQYLWQMATGWRGKRPSAREALRPDLWPPADAQQMEVA